MSEAGETAPSGSASQTEPGEVSFCPHCGARLPDESLVVELWEADQTIHHLWCQSCGFACDVVQSERVTAHEPAEE